MDERVSARAAGTRESSVRKSIDEIRLDHLKVTRWSQSMPVIIKHADLIEVPPIHAEGQPVQ